MADGGPSWWPSLDTSLVNSWVRQDVTMSFIGMCMHSIFLLRALSLTERLTELLVRPCTMGLHRMPCSAVR